MYHPSSTILPFPCTLAFITSSGDSQTGRLIYHRHKRQDRVVGGVLFIAERHVTIGLGYYFE